MVIDVASAAKILKLFLPSSLQMLTDWMRPLAFNLFTSANIKASHLSSEAAALEEDAVGLAVMSLNLLLFATAYGFNGAMDSYTSIAFGAQDRRELFAVLVRQLLLLGGLAIIAGLLLVNAESLLLAIGVQADLAARAAELLHLMGWAVPGDFIYDCVARWMRGQQLHRNVSACSVAALGVNLLVNLQLMGSDDPTRGPLLALIAQNTLLPFLLVAAFCFGTGNSPAELLADVRAAMPSAGPSSEKLLGQLRTAVAAMVWTCAELWAWEVQVFEAARLGRGNAAAYTLLSSTYSLLICMFPISIASAASALMGEALGQDDPQRALRLLRTACTLTLLLVLGYTAIMYVARAEVAALLCGGVAEVAAAYTRTLPLVLSMHFLDGLFNAFKSWLVLRRKQAFGAVMSIIVYYCIGVPFGCYLAFWRSWGLLGLWTGLGLAVLLGVLAAGVQAVLDINQLLRDAGPGSLAANTTLSTSSDDPDYVDAEVLIAAQAKEDHGEQASSRHAPSWRELNGHLVWLALLLAPGLATFASAVATPVEQPTAPQPPAPHPVLVGRSLLQGASPCTWSTGGAFYNYPFNAFWNATSGDYGWQVRISDRSQAVSGTDAGRRLQAGRRLRAASRAASRAEAAAGGEGREGLRLGTDHDVYDVPYVREFSDELEVGWAAWLVPPEVRADPNSAGGEWTSYAFVGTRVSTADHTFCGCQTMRGDASRFRLTEHGRAQLPIAPQQAGARPSGRRWYLNLTRAQINEQIRATCQGISATTTCPTDNATAIAEWEDRKENGTYWTLPPWVELYDSLPQ